MISAPSWIWVSI